MDWSFVFFFNSVLLGVGLAMDAFSVSICKGLATKELKLKHMIITGAWFGGFQALMPLIGYYVGSFFKDYVEAVDHWIIFALLALIGANMIKESFSGDECPANAGSFGVKTMFTMALATSIDALAVGVIFAAQKTNLVMSVSVIAAITFVVCLAGVVIGNRFGSRYEKKAELAGGIVLVIIGIKLLIDGLLK